MHALSLLQNSLGDALSFLHLARLKALLAAVTSLLGGGRLSLTALGRRMSLPVDGRRRHQIKRVDRLLGNKLLLTERPEIYKAIAHKVIGAAVRIPIVVDWTFVGPDTRYNALVASVPIRSRVIPIYANPRVERAFLVRLKRCIPAHCKPILVTDAGFCVPWFQAVVNQGWDFRGRGRVQVQVKPDVWCSIRALFRRARRQPSDLVVLALTKQKAFAARVILIRQKRAKRPRRSLGKRRKLPAKRKDMNQSERYRTAAREPWLLLTFCTRFSPRRVVGLYKTRMATEEIFSRPQKLSIWSVF